MIDYKTSSTPVPKNDLPEHPQLGAYQVAVLGGAFAEGDTSAGAALVQLSTGSGGPDLSRLGYRQAEVAWVRSV